LSANSQLHTSQRAGVELGVEAPKLLYQRHPRLKLAQRLWQDQRRIDGGASGSAAQNICYLLRDIYRNMHLRLLGRSAQVRRCYRVRMLGQGTWGRPWLGWLLGEDIERCPRHVSSLKRLQQSGFVYHTTPCAVDDACSRSQLGKLLGANQPARRRGKRGV